MYPNIPIAHIPTQISIKRYRKKEEIQSPPPPPFTYYVVGTLPCFIRMVGVDVQQDNSEEKGDSIQEVTRHCTRTEFLNNRGEEEGSAAHSEEYEKTNEAKDPRGEISCTCHGLIFLPSFPRFFSFPFFLFLFFFSFLSRIPKSDLHLGNIQLEQAHKIAESQLA